MPSRSARNGNGSGAALQEPEVLKLLPEGIRALVANSFVPASFPFGSVIAREGDEADALYLLVSGRARVLTKFTWPAVVDRCLELYAGCTGIS